MYDGRSQLGYMPKQGFLYNQQTERSDACLWKGAVEVIQGEKYEQNEFIQALKNGGGDEESFDLTGKATYWTDYCQSHFHPKSIYAVQDIQPWDEFHNFYHGSFAGSKLNSKEKEDAWESIRFYLEDSDRLEGFQCFLDADSGWGAFGAEMLTDVREECRSANITAYGLNKAYPLQCEESPFQKTTSAVNVALSTVAIQEIVDLYIPMEVEFYATKVGKRFGLNANENYHSSALAALVIQGITNCYTSSSMNHVTQTMHKSGNFFGIAEVCCIPDFKTECIGDSFQYHSMLSSPSIPSKNLAEFVCTTTSCDEDKSSLVEILANDPYEHWELGQVDGHLLIPASFPNLNQKVSLSLATQLSVNSRIGEHLKSLSPKFMHPKILHDYLQAGMEKDVLATYEAKFSALVQSHSV